MVLLGATISPGAEGDYFFDYYIQPLVGIAKITIASLIDTLQENDYFNVITVNTEATYLVPCIKYLIQATKQNKELMKKKVQNLSEADGTIDVDVGMDEAFKILNDGMFFIYL